MRYVVYIDGERHEVELNGAAASIGGRDYAVHLSDSDGSPVSLLKVGDQVHRVVAVRRATRGTYTIWVDGHRFEADALDERSRAIRDMTAAVRGPAGPAPVIAPMPGMIVRVHVAAGDDVAAGQGLVVMEAMKMENELRAPAAGRVRNVLVTAGQAVEKGALLVELE